jgi:hypothetical protein
MIHEVVAKRLSLLAIIAGNPDTKFHTVQKYHQKSGNNMLRYDFFFNLVRVGG